MVLIIMTYSDVVERFHNSRIRNQYYAVVDGVLKVLVDPEGGSVPIYSQTMSDTANPVMDLPRAIPVSDIIFDMEGRWPPA